MLCIADLYRRKPDQPERIGSEKLATKRTNFTTNRSCRRRGLVTTATPILNLCNGFELMTVFVDLILTDNFWYILFTGWLSSKT